MRSTRRFRLTKASKILIFILVVALIGGGVSVGLKTGVVKTNSDKKESVSENKNDYNDNNTISADEDGNVINTDKSDDKTINISLDEWIG